MGFLVTFLYMNRTVLIIFTPPPLLLIPLLTTAPRLSVFTSVCVCMM